MEFLAILLVSAVALLLCYAFLCGFAALISRSEHESKAERLEEQHNNASHARGQDRRNILNAATGCQDEQSRAMLLSHYGHLRERDECLSAQEIRAIVNEETCIDDQTQYELDHGINPYKNVVDNRYAPSGKRVRAKR